MINGFTSASITKLDVLSGLEKIKICTHYEVDGKKVEDYPTNLKVLEKCKPVYEEVDGWNEDLTGVTKLSDLPENARAYLDKLQEVIGVPTSIVSVGPDRSQTIIIKESELF